MSRRFTGLAATVICAGLAAAVGCAGVLPALSRSPASAAPTTTEPPSKWKGSGPSCVVVLPEPPGWYGEGTFWTCPPKRVLFIGDSVATTMAIETTIDEENWGVLQAADPILGCGFITGLEVDFTGTFVKQNTACASAFTTWRDEVAKFKPQAVVVELGWWDAMLHLRDGKVVGLGQDWYDTYLVGRITDLVRYLTYGNPEIDFLTVPWMNPPRFSDGRIQLAATAPYHDKINALLAQAVAESPARVHLIDISPYITPAGHFEFDVGGQQCRQSDGVHLYVGEGYDFVMTPCGRALQAGVFNEVREQIPP